MSVPRKPEIDAAIEVLESGKAESFSDAARQTGANPNSVIQRWRSSHPSDDPDWIVPTVSTVDRALDDAGDDDPEPTARERELARRVLDINASRSRLGVEAREAKRQVKGLEAELATANDTLSLIKNLSNRLPNPDWLAPRGLQHGRRATLLATFSDYHIGEVVEPSEMNFYNAYNIDIAEERVRRFFERTITMSRQYLTGVTYDGIMVPSLGDTISGEIHDEFVQTNELTNFEAIPYAVAWICEGLGLFADEFGKVHYAGVPGNHPRDSRKPRYKKRSAHNADTLISWLVAKHFENDDRFTFDIPDGISADFSIYDTKFRIEHGDEATGGGGIQGAMLPLALRTHRIRKQAESEGSPFDVVMYGHWHQLMFLLSKGFMVNGAGKGYDEYARGKGFEPEKPQQALMVVTPEHGISVQAPLFVSDRDAEGW